MARRRQAEEREAGGADEYGFPGSDGRDFRQTLILVRYSVQLSLAHECVASVFGATSVLT